MRKNTFVLVAVCFASALFGAGVASYAVVRNAQVATTIEYVNRDGDTVPVAKTQFVALEQSTSYPDLTYAAENAVKAVVNIEAITEIEVRQQGMMPYNPFFEFFGFPQPQQQGGHTWALVLQPQGWCPEAQGESSGWTVWGPQPNLSIYIQVYSSALSVCK